MEKFQVPFTTDVETFLNSITIGADPEFYPLNKRREGGESTNWMKKFYNHINECKVPLIKRMIGYDNLNDSNYQLDDSYDSQYLEMRPGYFKSIPEIMQKLQWMITYAYTKGLLMDVTTDDTIGAHIHIGHEYSSPNVTTARSYIGKFLAYFVGNPLYSLNPEGRINSYYAQTDNLCSQSYGEEYKVLSSRILLSPKLTFICFNLVKEIITHVYLSGSHPDFLIYTTILRSNIKSTNYSEDNSNISIPSVEEYTQFGIDRKEFFDEIKKVKTMADQNIVLSDSWLGLKL